MASFFVSYEHVVMQKIIKLTFKLNYIFADIKNLKH
jgi:hypothetical protein